MDREVWIWSTFRDRAVEAFGSFPPVKDEAALLEAFERQPVAVANALDKVIERHAAGKVQAPWRIWTLEVTSRGNVSVKVGPSREKRVSQAYAWLENAGLYCDRAGEVELELFGDTQADPFVVHEGNPRAGEPVRSSETGLLSQWRDDEALRGQMLDRWRELRARGELVELEADERQARHGDELRARGWPKARDPKVVTKLARWGT